MYPVRASTILSRAKACCANRYQRLAERKQRSELAEPNALRISEYTKVLHQKILCNKGAAAEAVTALHELYPSASKCVK